jgi:hypothetical protein
MKRQTTNEWQRLLEYLPFLHAIGTLPHAQRFPIYYPGAGLDFHSFFATGLRQGIFVDPKYFGRRSTDLPVNQIRQLLYSFDSRALVSMPASNILRARLNLAGQQKDLWLIKAANNQMHQVLRSTGARQTIYLAKGTAQERILCPPSSIALLKPIAYALDIPLLGDIAGRIAESYTNVLFDQPASDSHRLCIFKDYRAPLSASRTLA